MKLKILDKMFRTGKRDVAKEQGVIDKSTQMEIRTYVNKSKKLLETAETIGTEHDAGKHSIKSIDGLKQQISNLQSAGHELQHNLKKLSGLPHRMTGLLDEQIDCKNEINRLKQENHTLNKIKKSGTVKKSAIDEKRAINNGAITDLKKKIDENKAELKDFHSGSTVEKLKDNVNNNLINLKKAVATLEFKIRSIEKGPAPKPPIQSLKGQDPKTPIQPVRPVPLSPKEIRDNLQKLAGSFNNHGADDTGKQSLREKLALLNKFGIIDDENLQNMQNSINKPTITGQELSNIISTVTKSIDHDVDSRMEKFINRPKTFEERFADRFAGRVEGNKKDQTFADRVEERTQEGNNKKDQTFAGKVKGRAEEENKTYRL